MISSVSCQRWKRTLAARLLELHKPLGKRRWVQNPASGSIVKVRGLLAPEKPLGGSSVYHTMQIGYIESRMMILR